MDFFYPNKKVIPLPLCHCFHFENGVQFEFNAEIKLRNFLSEKEREQIKLVVSVNSIFCAFLETKFQSVD